MRAEDHLSQKEQELLIGAQQLHQARQEMLDLKARLRQAWNAPETIYILEAVDKIAAELAREEESMERLAADISQKAVQRRAQEELFQDNLMFLDGLF